MFLRQAFDYVWTGERFTNRKRRAVEGDIILDPDADWEIHSLGALAPCLVDLRDGVGRLLADCRPGSHIARPVVYPAGSTINIAAKLDADIGRKRPRSMVALRGVKLYLQRCPCGAPSRPNHPLCESCDMVQDLNDD